MIAAYFALYLVGYCCRSVQPGDSSTVGKAEGLLTSKVVRWVPRLDNNLIVLFKYHSDQFILSFLL